MKKIKEFANELILLQRNVPGLLFALFVIAIVSMNLLANKSINMPFDFMALDCGFIFSWITFFVMDVMTKRFGPRGATLVSVMALMLNLFVAFMLFLGSAIGGVWGESYVEGSEDIINNALNNTFGGTWYVLLGSSIAYICSAFVNNYVNWSIGKRADKGGFKGFALRSYISTFIGQMVDNLIFALIVSLHFFGWSLVQCIVCALTGAVFELICEVIFSPIGFKIARNWEKDKVGQAYIDYAKKMGYKV